MRPADRILVVDWFRLIWDMVQRGEPLVSIYRRTGIAEGTLREYLKGSQPPHWRGERLIEMWCVVCGTVKADAPMTKIVLAPRVVHAKPQVDAEDAAMQRLERAWRATA